MDEKVRMSVQHLNPETLIPVKFYDDLTFKHQTLNISVKNIDQVYTFQLNNKFDNLVSVFS